MTVGLRLQLVVGAAVLTLITCFWLGEHNSQFLPLKQLLAVLPAMIISIFLLWRLSRRIAAIAATLMLLGSVGAFICGSRLHTLALNDCIENCFHIQAALEEHLRVHGTYPDSLSDLNRGLPGQVTLPPQILKYERTSEGYTLWIADSWMSYAGNQSVEFHAHK
jgi:hypothetical protein